MQARDIALIDELREKSAENTCLEFKKDNDDSKLIGKLCSALSNAARIENKDLAYVLWGINNHDHSVIGTQFDPDSK